MREPPKPYPADVSQFVTNSRVTEKTNAAKLIQKYWRQYKLSKSLQTSIPTHKKRKSKIPSISDITTKRRSTVCHVISSKVQTKVSST